MSVRVKVCGLTRPADAELAVVLGAGLLGLNFYPRSPRRVDLEMAREIATIVAGRALLVGVFVDAPQDEVERVAAAVPLDLLQFHGDEGPAALEPFGGRAIKVLRDERPPDGELLASYPTAWGFLLDRRHQRLYGGTGETWDFAATAGAGDGRPVLLAGGIGPDNVRAVVAAGRPWGVDVCSRVEARPGVKDPDLLRRLFDEVRDADEAR
jgi:phosphoribosylanthranilate isomerase